MHRFWTVKPNPDARRYLFLNRDNALLQMAAWKRQGHQPCDYKEWEPYSAALIFMKVVIGWEKMEWGRHPDK